MRATTRRQGKAEQRRRALVTFFRFNDLKAQVRRRTSQDEGTLPKSVQKQAILIVISLGVPARNNHWPIKYIFI